MHDACTVGLSESLTHLRGDVDDVVEIQRPPSDPLLECLPLVVGRASSQGSTWRGAIIPWPSGVGGIQVAPVARTHHGRPREVAHGSRHALWWLLLLSSPIRPGGEAGAQQNDADGKKK